MKWRKDQPQEEPPRNDRMARLGDHDLFTFVEAEIMNAGHDLSQYAIHAGGLVGLDHLNDAIAHLLTAVTACEEIKARRP